VTDGGEDQLLGVGAQRGVPLGGPDDGGQVVAVLAELVQQLLPRLGLAALARRAASTHVSRTKGARTSASKPVGLQGAVGRQGAEASAKLPGTGSPSSSRRSSSTLSCCAAAARMPSVMPVGTTRPCRRTWCGASDSPTLHAQVSATSSGVRSRSTSRVSSATGSTSYTSGAFPPRIRSYLTMIGRAAVQCRSPG
jgi:hypothetical protein